VAWQFWKWGTKTLQIEGAENALYSFYRKRAVCLWIESFQDLCYSLKSEGYTISIFLSNSSSNSVHGITQLLTVNKAADILFSCKHLRCLTIISNLNIPNVFLGCIECMRCRLLLPMCTMSVCQSVCHAAQLGFTVRGHSTQPLPNYFGLIFVTQRNSVRCCSFICMFVRRTLLRVCLYPTFVFCYVYCISCRFQTHSVSWPDVVKSD